MSEVPPKHIPRIFQEALPSMAMEHHELITVVRLVS